MWVAGEVPCDRHPPVTLCVQDVARDSVVQAKAPPSLIDAGLPTEALLAQVAVSKYADGLPLTPPGSDLRP